MSDPPNAASNGTTNGDAATAEDEETPALPPVSKQQLLVNFYVMDASGHGNSEYEKSNALTVYNSEGELNTYVNPKYKENPRPNKLSIANNTKTPIWKKPKA